MSEKIYFQVLPIDFVTECPYNQKRASTEKVLKVGSFECRSCRHNKRTNREIQYVICNFIENEQWRNGRVPKELTDSEFVKGMMELLERGALRYPTQSPGINNNASAMNLPCHRYYTCDCYGSKGALFASPRNTGNRMICAYCGKEMKEISMKQWLNSKGKYCIWIQDGYWFTGCGEKYATDDRVQYCPHCGKFVKRITIKQEHISVVNNSEKENQNEF